MNVTIPDQILQKYSTHSEAELVAIFEDMLDKPQTVGLAAQWITSVFLDQYHPVHRGDDKLQQYVFFAYRYIHALLLLKHAPNTQESVLDAIKSNPDLARAVAYSEPDEKLIREAFNRHFQPPHIDLLERQTKRFQRVLDTHDFARVGKHANHMKKALCKTLAEMVLNGQQKEVNLIPSDISELLSFDTSFKAVFRHFRHLSKQGEGLPQYRSIKRAFSQFRWMRRLNWVALICSGIVSLPFAAFFLVSLVIIITQGIPFFVTPQMKSSFLGLGFSFFTGVCAIGLREVNRREAIKSLKDLHIKLLQEGR